MHKFRFSIIIFHSKTLGNSIPRRSTIAFAPIFYSRLSHVIATLSVKHCQTFVLQRSILLQHDEKLFANSELQRCPAVSNRYQTCSKMFFDLARWFLHSPGETPSPTAKLIFKNSANGGTKVAPPL